MSAEPARAVWFLDAAEDDIVAAFERVIHRSTRRCLMGRFPFEILYRLEDGLLVVVACMHAARDPKAVLRRIGA